jgi:methionyl-tRNA formyltransferase
MKIVFFGTPHFAVEILDALLKAGLNLVAIVTRPDKPKGRNLQLQPSPVKIYHAENLLPVPLFQPEKASHPDFIDILQNLSPDFFVVVGYGEILKQALLDVPTKAPINIHTSLLPAYRGAAPIQRAMMAGEKVIGITVMKMNALMDAGEILLQKSIAISENDCYPAVEKRMIQIASSGIVEVLADFPTYEKSAKTQDLSKVSHAPKIEQEDCQISWDNPAEKILCQIKALTPRPAAWTTFILNGAPKRVKILDATYLDIASPFKQLIHDNTRALIGCGLGSIELLQLQVEGKGVMMAREFLNGYQQFFPISIV